MISQSAIDNAKEHFATIINEQIARVDAVKNEGAPVDYGSICPVVIGIIGGDGIGPAIADVGRQVLKELLSAEVAAGKVEFRNIEGLTIENRAAHLQSIPDDVLEEIKSCHVTLKGPTTTPEKGDEWPNLESANVGMRKALDLFANVRPVRVPSEGIDWTFFRENTEDLYALGSQGIDVTDDISIDFPDHLYPWLRTNNPRCIRPRPPYRQGPGHGGHQGEHHQGRRRPFSAGGRTCGRRLSRHFVG